MSLKSNFKNITKGIVSIFLFIVQLFPTVQVFSQEPFRLDLWLTSFNKRYDAIEFNDLYNDLDHPELIDSILYHNINPDLDGPWEHTLTISGSKEYVEIEFAVLLNPDLNKLSNGRVSTYFDVFMPIPGEHLYACEDERLHPILVPRILIASKESLVGH